MPSGPYRWLATYYDHLRDFRRPYQKARRLILGPLLPEVRAACDLCCGTGDLLVDWAGRGIRTYGVDLSPEMCRLARRKAAQAGMRLRVIRADMRSFQLPEPVGLVTCEFDALNHLPQKRDLGKVLRAVRGALADGGHFAFDVNNRAAFEKVWGHTWFLEKDPVAVVMRGGHKAGTDRAWTDIEWFIRTGTSWKRHHERVEEVCWSANEMREELKSAGFAGIRTWDAAPLFGDALTPVGARTFWLARKRSGRG